jgi:hypothetical protein
MQFQLKLIMELIACRIGLCQNEEKLHLTLTYQTEKSNRVGVLSVIRSLEVIRVCRIELEVIRGDSEFGGESLRCLNRQTERPMYSSAAFPCFLVSGPESRMAVQQVQCG